MESRVVRVAGRDYRLAVAGHRGYPAVRWAKLPEGLIEAPLRRGSLATAVSAGEPLLIYAGSPFGRHGDRAFQLANAPYLEGDDLWVPLQLFTDWLPTAARADRRPAAVEEQNVDRAGRVSPVLDRRAGPWRVVIDPGHGGHDPGTMNRRTGAREKDITLRVARYLFEELDRGRGVEAHLTRDRDMFVKVKERPRKAMALDADLFISIHVNAEPGRRTSASGFETYYLGRARTEESRAVAMRENAVVALEDGGEPSQPVEFILSGWNQDVNRDESSRFGGHVQNSLRTVMGSRDRGVKPGPFYVLLTNGSMPTVLVELGFITNAAEAKRLTSKAKQKEIARALAATIQSYFEERGRRTAVMEGRG
jgi:N-acetylmuramoyl-L-alanine amidase